MRRPFISYAREDRQLALRLYEDLKRAGASPWLDAKEIRAGEEWRRTIREALRLATHVIALISKHSVNKQGYVQSELRYALEILDEMPPGQIFLIPVHLDHAQPHHERLRDFHRVDLFKDYETGLAQILDSIRITSKSSIRPTVQPTLSLAAGSIAHELNNVLMGIMPFLELLKRGPHSPKRIRNIADLISQSAARGRMIASEVLSLARPVQLELRPITVKQWLAAIAPELRGLAGASIRFKMKPSRPGLRIIGDEMALTQVITNIVANAIQAIESDGDIVITADRSDVTFGETSTLCIAIADTGAGIAPEDVERIYEPFFTTKRRGSGLGLSVAQRIVAAHGGALVVDSAVGKGSTFYVYLPEAITPKRATRSAVSKRRAKPTRKTSAKRRE